MMNTTLPTYSLSVPALGTIKFADVSADAISRFLSNRIDCQRYQVTGSDGTSVRGDEWMTGEMLRGEQEVA